MESETFGIVHFLFCFVFFLQTAVGSVSSHTGDTAQGQFVQLLLEANRLLKRLFTWNIKGPSKLLECDRWAVKVGSMG